MKKLILALAIVLFMAPGVFAHSETYYRGKERHHYHHSGPTIYHTVCYPTVEMIFPGVFIPGEKCEKFMYPKGRNHNRHYNPGRNWGHSPNRGNHPHFDYDLDRPYHRR